MYIYIQLLDIVPYIFDVFSFSESLRNILFIKAFQSLFIYLFTLIIIDCKERVFHSLFSKRKLLTGVAGVALAKVVRGGSGSGLEASTVLTVMMRARTGLRVEHDCRWCGLAISPRVIRRALTLVIVYAVDASSTVLKEEYSYYPSRERERGGGCAALTWHI